MKSYSHNVKAKELKFHTKYDALPNIRTVGKGEDILYDYHGDVRNELEDVDYQILSPYISHNKKSSKNKSKQKSRQNISQNKYIPNEKQTDRRLTKEDDKKAYLQQNQGLPNTRAPKSKLSSYGRPTDHKKNSIEIPQGDYLLKHDQITDVEYDRVEDIFSDGTGRARYYISIFNKTIGDSSNYDCRTLYALSPAPSICIFDTSCDRPVSDSIKYFGVWDPRETVFVLDILKNNTGMNIIDLGSKIGQLSLLAASLGRKVLAVDANIESIRRLKRSAELGGYGRNVTVLHNLIYDKRGIYDVTIEQTNQANVRIVESNSGGAEKISSNTTKPAKCTMKTKAKVKSILMNDLLKVVKFNHTILSLDLHGHEHKVFRFANKLFDQLDIPYVLVHWAEMRKKYVARDHYSREKELVQHMVVFLQMRDYLVYSFVTGLQLDMDHWAVWPENVVFIREGVKIYLPLRFKDWDT